MFITETVRLTLYSLVTPLIMFASSYDEAEELARLEESRAKWESIRAECKGDYQYQVVQSKFSGRIETTTVVVDNNQVVARKLEIVDATPSPTVDSRLPPSPKLAWHEQGEEVGSHRDHDMPARTLDEMYDLALEMSKQSPAPNTKRSVAFDEQGILRYCFEFDTRIMDDAPKKGILPFKLILPTHNDAASLKK